MRGFASSRNRAANFCSKETTMIYRTLTLVAAVAFFAGTVFAWDSTDTTYGDALSGSYRNCARSVQINKNAAHAIEQCQTDGTGVALGSSSCAGCVRRIA
jgi:hypothetical protein